MQVGSLVRHKSYRQQLGIVYGMFKLDGHRTHRCLVHWDKGERESLSSDILEVISERI